MTPEEVKQLVERLEWNADLTIKRDLSLGMNKLLSEAASALTLLAQEREELREAAMIGRNTALAIQKATLEGRVCNDVAWFSEIETLNDFCASAIENIDNHIARAALKDT